MPMREYVCAAGHRTEKLVHGDPPQQRVCECGETAELDLFPAPQRFWIPSADFKSATARGKYKDAQRAR